MKKRKKVREGIRTGCDRNPDRLSFFVERNFKNSKNFPYLAIDIQKKMGYNIPVI